MKKALLAAGTAAAVLLAVSGCSSTAPSSAASAPAASALSSAKGVTNITLWHGLAAANGIALQTAVDDFNSAHTGKIHVTAAYQGVYADLLAKYTAAIRSKSTPTVLLGGDIATGFLTDAGQTIPAATMAKANPSVLNLSDLSAQARAYYTVSGTERAVPMNVSTPVLWVNTNILKKAGVDTASLGTLDGVIAAAKQIKAKTGIAGFSTQDDDWYIEQLTATAGQDFCTPDNGRTGKTPTGITINQGLAKQNIEALSALYTSKVAVDGAADGSAAISAFQAGKVGMIIMSSGILGALRTGPTIPYEALHYPTSGPSGTSGNVIGGSALWLSRTATPAQQVAGWELEAYLTSPAVQEQFSHATGYIPINTKTASLASQQSYLAANPNSKLFSEQLASTPVVTATAGCVSGAMQSIKTSNMSQITAAWSGQKSIDAALDAAAASATKLFATYQQQVGK